MTDSPFISFISILNFLGGIQGFFLAFLLLIVRRELNFSNRYLACILIVLGCIMLHQFAIETNYIASVPMLAGITMPMEIIISPALYLYIRSMIKPELIPTARNTYLHFLPAGIALLVAIPFFLLPFEEKLSLILSAFASSEWHGTMNIVLPIIFALGGGVFTIYLVLSLKMLFEHNKAINNIFSYKERVSLKWLRNLLVLFIIFWLMLMVFFTELESSTGTVTLMKYLSVLTVISIHYLGVMGLLQPIIFKREDLLVSVEEDVSSIEQSESAQEPEKYKKSALTPEMANKISERLTTIMVEQKPHMNSNLSLAILAKQVATSPNYLSQVINEHLQQTFFDYINSYRVEYAKHLLVNPLPTTPTILDIAMESAFNSKSAFYTAFKKHTGLTPTQYKNQL